MDADPGHVIRALRLALDMSQAQFARAAGWSPSTISSWERGRAKPSRLAFKTILAFAEERGVRYRPRATTTALVPMPGTPTPGSAATGDPSSPPGPRPALRPLVYPEPPFAGASVPPPATDHRPPPRWSAEARFRVTLGARREPARSGPPRGLVEVGIVALAFAAALALHDPVHRLLHRAAPAAAATAAAVAPASARHAPQPAPPAPAVVTSDPVPAPAGPAAAAAPVATARLESVMAIGVHARATFRTANDAVTVVAGEWVGGQRVAAIADDGVTLVDRAGMARRVRVGQHTTFE
jgi:transcriptional regulator with XRE-family HTH domain